MQNTLKMANLHIPDMIKFINYVQPVVLFTGAIICFFTAVAHGHVSWYLPFISETGAFAPEIGIFSWTLIIGSFSGVIMILYRHIALSKLIEEPAIKKLNQITTTVGSISMIGLAGVAAFPMTTVFFAHLTFAGIYFSMMAFYTVLTTFLTLKKDGFSTAMKIRSVLSTFTMGILVLLIICFPIAHERWHSQNTIIPALKVPENHGFVLVLVSSIFEWAFMLNILLFTLFLFMDIKHEPLIVTQNLNEERSNVAVGTDLAQDLEKEAVA